VRESAGGNFCLALMLRAKTSGMSLPHAAVLMSPWCDLTNSGDSRSSNNGRDPKLTAQHINFAAKHYAGKNNLNDPIISPINGEFDDTFPPTLITSGSRDLLMSQSSGLANILRRQGVFVNLRIWKDLWHVFEWDDQLPEAYQSISEIGEFLTGHMNKAFEC
jgi:monoterpene epsilon-lactone hydrolase